MSDKSAVSTAAEQEIPATTETQSLFQKQLSSAEKKEKDFSHGTFQHEKE